jgi:hypothetical protein
MFDDPETLAKEYTRFQIDATKLAERVYLPGVISSRVNAHVGSHVSNLQRTSLII